MIGYAFTFLVTYYMYEFRIVIYYECIRNIELIRPLLDPFGYEL